MPKQVEDVELLQEYVNGVIGRADHHAKNVNEIIYSLVGAIVAYKDKDPLKVLTQDGEMKNALWVTINRKKYALSFNHVSKEIELRSGTLKGEVIHSFSNSTSNSLVREVFENL